MKIQSVLFYLLTVILLSSCVTPQNTNLIQDIKKNYRSETSLEQDYRIIPGDQLTLVIYTLDEEMKNLFSMFTRTQNISGGSSASNNVSTKQEKENVLNVYSDGSVKIPYIGHIQVQGLSLLDAKKAIENKFQSFSPNITIELNLQNRYFSLLGAISESRVAMPSTRINIFQALALGGNIDTFGDRRKVSIVRQTPDGSEVKTFDLRSKDIIDSEYYYIQPNDVIYIQELSRTFFGRITTFSGLLGGLGVLTTIAALITAVINWTN